MTKALGWIVALIIIVAAGGYYWYTQIPQVEAPTAKLESTTPTPQPTTNTPAANDDTRGAAMIGTWRSTTDTKFTREIRGDGVLIDHYVGDTNAGTSGLRAQKSP